MQYHETDQECLLLDYNFLTACDNVAVIEKVEQGHDGFYEIRLPTDVIRLRKSHL